MRRPDRGHGAARSVSSPSRGGLGRGEPDRTFTGQKADGPGLLYYPALGTFLSPDILVPDPGAVIDYNRFAYARNNPIKYGDPSGYAPNTQGIQIRTMRHALQIGAGKIAGIWLVDMGGMAADGAKI